MVQICGCRLNHIFFTLKSQIYIYAPNSVYSGRGGASFGACMFDLSV